MAKCSVNTIVSGQAHFKMGDLAKCIVAIESKKGSRRKVGVNPISAIQTSRLKEGYAI